MNKSKGLFIGPLESSPCAITGYWLRALAKICFACLDFWSLLDDDDDSDDSDSEELELLSLSLSDEDSSDEETYFLLFCFAFLVAVLAGFDSEDDSFSCCFYSYWLFLSFYNDFFTF